LLGATDGKDLIGGLEREVREYAHFARKNAKDIVAVGFHPDRTLYFPMDTWVVISTDLLPRLQRYVTVLRLVSLAAGLIQTRG
jgi:hypothetical protein